VKLLLDENLSPKLVPRSRELYGDLVRVREVGLRQADDRGIWDWAKVGGYAIIASHADFVAMSHRLGFPPKVVHIEQCDFPFRIIEDLLRRSAIRIPDFEKDGAEGVLSLGVPRSADCADERQRCPVARRFYWCLAFAKKVAWMSISAPSRCFH
jgi:predicted nuclease of predicted toxin-antitoxin system